MSGSSGYSGYSFAFNPSTTLPVRQPVRVVTTSDIPNLLGGAPVNVDGVTLVAGDRVLVQGQLLGASNGIYTVRDPGTGSNGIWDRASDFNLNDDVFDGIEVRVTQGTANGESLWVLTTSNPITLDSTPLTFTKQGSGGGGGGALNVFDEGQPLGSFTSMNFVGAQVVAAAVSGVATVYVPPPAPVTYASHWNTADGDDGDQTVSDSVNRTSAFIASPTTAGTPFDAGSWAASVHDATRDTSAVYTTPGLTTGFGGNAYAVVRVLDADAVSVLSSFTSPSLAADGTASSAGSAISITISQYQPNNNRFMAKMSVTVSFGAILAALNRAGGKFTVEITMHTDTETDGTGPYTFTSSAVFQDSGTTPPTVSGPATLAPTAGQTVTKYLSGVAYYTNGTKFSLGVSALGALNSNVARTSGALNIGAAQAGIDAFDQSPLPGGNGSSYFTGWSAAYDVSNVSYLKPDATLNRANYRQMTTTAVTSAFARDPWGQSSALTSAALKLLIDTYITTSGNLIETFDDEDRRQDAGFNNGLTAGNWDSTAALVAGQAMVYGGRLRVPSQTRLTDGTANTNWTTFNPAGSPDYTNMDAPVSYFRTMVDTSGLDRASFQLVFTGTFVTSAAADLAANLMVIRIRRVGSGNGGHFGPTSPPLYLSGGLYDFAEFDDGVTNGQIREGTSSGNTVNGTFGGFVCNGGFYIEIALLDPRISLDSYTVVFF